MLKVSRNCISQGGKEDSIKDEVTIHAIRILKDCRSDAVECSPPENGIVWPARPSQQAPRGEEGKGRPFPSSPLGACWDGLAGQTKNGTTSRKAVWNVGLPADSQELIGHQIW